MKRALHFVAGSLVIGMATVSACGGNSTAPAVADSGTTATDATDNTKAADTGRDAKPVDGATCDLSTDFTKLPLPDASLTDGGEGGVGITPAVCIACLDAKCPTEKAACNANCECKGVVADVLVCVGAGGDIVTCGAGALTLSADAQKIGLALLGCINSNCKTECVPANLQDASLGDAKTDG